MGHAVSAACAGGAAACSRHAERMQVGGAVSAAGGYSGVNARVVASPEPACARVKNT